MKTLRLIGFIAAMILAVPSFGQATQTDTIYSAVEVTPEFPGGLHAFYKFVQEKYKTPRAVGKQKGRVIATFVVEKDGKLTDIRIVKDMGFGTGEELVRVLKKSPKWSPGLQNNKPVRVQYSLPLVIAPEQ